MGLYTNASDMIPEGIYPVRASDTVELCADPRSGGAMGIKIFLYLETEPGADPVTREHIECIDKSVPIRGAAKKTPFDFTRSTLTALGVSEGDIDPEIRAGLEAYSEDESAIQFKIKGLGGADNARIKVTHARLDSGWAENLSIQWSGATPSKAKSLLASFGGGASAKPSPFAAPPRGTPVRPPMPAR